MATIETTIGGITFSIDPADPNGIGELQGWYSGAPKRIVVDDRPNNDGAFDVVKDYRSARVITQRGLMSAASVDEAVTDVWAEFAALQSSGEPSTFSVTDGGGTKSCSVSVVTNDIEPGIDGDAEYVLQLVARDPIKYLGDVDYVANVPTAGGGLEYNLFDGGSGGSLYYGSNGDLGRVDVANSGTADVWPTFTVTGELTTGFYLQELGSGSILRYDRIVPAGSSVTLNSRTGEVLIDGVSDGSTYLTIGQWFAVPAKSSVTVQFNPIAGTSGTPQMTATAPAGGYW